ncbi:MAG TPA: hypothetical protein PKZ36_01240 [Candidatus Paceibacterota bacterium]|nr:hypothetical protein [Candidatus Paceibacterota bacterium]HPT18014.1 hypothetical protein [Candidatus Paceibacterota bacterium]
MTEKLKQTIKEQMVIMPKESQEVVNNFDWVKISEEIGKKYLLSEEEINILQAEIATVLVCAEDQDYLTQDIENEVGTSKTEAEKIASEVLEKIFKPLIENLSKKIKLELKDRPINWQQNLDFILSGGDYTAFIRKPIKEEDNVAPQGNTFSNYSDLDDLKSKFTI